MKRFLPYILASLAITAVVVVPDHFAQAQSLFGIPNIWDLMLTVIASVVQGFMWVANILVAIAGQLLNVSIVLTLRIKEFVDSTPAIYTIWQTLRDVTNIFIIFFLLWAAIRMIIGKDEKLGELISNIVIAGVLINFSFFFTSLGIDASNIISQAIYNQMLPYKVVTINSSSSLDSITKQVTSGGEQGGLADIFMQNLKLQSLYNANGLTSAGQALHNADGASKYVGAPIKIILSGVVGVIIMITAAVSFTLAALAFIYRFIILIFILAFSPIWFASHVIPQLQAKSKVISEQYKAQLMFMPVYLLLMYAALQILGNSKIFGDVLLPSTASGGTFDGLILLAINFAMVIFMLNLPLVVGLTMGGMATDWFKAENWGARKIFGYAGGWVGARTLGAGARKADKYLENTKAGNSLLGRGLRSVTTGALASNKMGYSYSANDLNKENKDIAKKKKEIGRRENLEQLLATAGATPAQHKAIIDDMNDKEKLNLGTKNLKNIEVLKHLKSGDFEAIKKSEDISDEDKKEIFTKRKEALNDAVGKGEKDVIKHMVENMDGKELIKLGDTVISDPSIIEHIKPNQLKTMAEEGLSETVRKNIGSTIQNWSTLTGTAHRSASFVRKNPTEWLP